MIMNNKRIFLRGLLAGLLSAFACIVYNEIYQRLMLTDFREIINAGSIIGSTLIGGMMMAVGYWVLFRFKRQAMIGWLNVMILVVSFLSIIPSFTMQLPLHIESPELFVGLSAPMHFLPALVFFGLEPFIPVVPRTESAA